MESIPIFTDNKKLVKAIPSTTKNICVYGRTASGKTTLTNFFKTEKFFAGWSFYHNDDYKRFGFEQSLYALMADLSEDGGAKVVEGVQVPRLLRKGFQCDLIIETFCSGESRVDRYKARGDFEKVKNLPGFDKTLDRIYAEFWALPGKKPLIYRLRTEVFEKE